MKIFKFLYLFVLFSLFLPRVYALSLDFNVKVDSTTVNKNDIKNISVLINNLKDEVPGIGACWFDLSFEGGVELYGNLSVPEGGTITKENTKYIIENNGLKNNINLFSLSVKVIDNGNLKLTNIQCSDGETNADIENREINFNVLEDNANDNSINSNDEIKDLEPVENLDGYLTNVFLSDGYIDFNSNVYEYTIIVKSFEDLVVTAEKDNNIETYTINKEEYDGKKLVKISTISVNGTIKDYVIYVNESDILEGEDTIKEDRNSFVPIFIGIILILVVINIFRIVKNIKKK